MSDLSGQTKSGLKWSAIDRILTQVIQLVVMLILARLLGPSAFGLIAMLSVFISISNAFVDSGFTSALIRKTNRDNTDLVTAFYYNILIGCICYILLYLSAPFIANFYQQSELQPLLRVLGLVVLVNSFIMIPRVILSVAMDFKSQAKVSVLSAIFSCIIAMIMAFNGYGAWSLVTQMLVNSIITALLLNLYVTWRPKGKVSKESFNYLFGFGSKLLLSSLLDVIYNNLYQVIIGKKSNPTTVGQFNQAYQLSSTPAVTMTGIIQKVTYPLFSQMQEDTDRIENAYCLTLKIAAVVIFPLIIGLAVIAKPLTILLLGPEWRDAGVLLSVLCLGFMLYPINSINLNFLQIKGRSDLFLKSDIIKKIIGIIVLLITVQFDVLAMCIGFTITSYIALLINTYYTARITRITQRKQCKDLFPIWLAVIISAVFSFWIGSLFNAVPWFQITSNLVTALFCYMLYLFFFQRPLLIQIRQAFKQ